MNETTLTAALLLTALALAPAASAEAAVSVGGAVQGDAIPEDGIVGCTLLFVDEVYTQAKTLEDYVDASLDYAFCA